MKKHLVTALKFILFLSLGILLLWFVFRSVSIEELFAGFKEVNYWWILLALCFAVISHLSRAMRWVLLAEPLGFKPRLINSVYAVMVGYLANLALPRLGEIMRPSILHRYEKVPLNTLIGTIIVERAMDLLTLLFIVILTIALQFDTISSFMADMMVSFMEDRSGGSMFTILIVSTLALLIIGGGTIYIALRYFKHTAIVQKIVFFAKGLLEAILSVRKLKKKGLFLLHTVVIWLCYYLMAYLPMFGYEPTSNLGPLVGLSVFTLGSLGIVAPVPGGIGAYHWIVFQTLLLYGIAATHGKIYAAIVWSSQLSFLLVFGFLSLILIPLTNRNNTKPETHGGDHPQEDIGS